MSDNYIWEIGQDPPTIEDHSIAKHDVLYRYLLRYVEVLTARIQRDSLRLTLVDGFSGGGLYRTTRGELHHGSPLRMIHAMAEAEVAANARRSKNFQLDPRFLFLDKEPRVLEFLREAVRQDRVGSRYERERRIDYVPGAFHENFERITRYVDSVNSRSRDPRIIFLLDQYGYKDVPLPQIRQLLSRYHNAEVMLTFATDWLLDYLSDKQTAPTGRLLEQMGLRHLQGSFDEIIEQKNRQAAAWRRAAQSLLYRDLVSESGARFFTPFFIHSSVAHRDYWFVHLSGHERARDEMAKLHWSIQNRFAHYGKSGLSMLGYDPDEDPLRTGQPSFNFGDSDKERSQQALYADVPRRLEAFGGQMPYEDFFRRVCNETPSTDEYMREVVSFLSREGDLEIINAEGKLRQRGVQVQNGDVIRLAKQTRLFGPPKDP